MTRILNWGAMLLVWAAAAYTVPLQAAVGDKGSSGLGDFVKAFPHVGLDDEIRLARFVFERDEGDAAGRAGALAQENQSRHANELAVLHRRERRRRHRERARG